MDGGFVVLRFCRTVNEGLMLPSPLEERNRQGGLIGLTPHFCERHADVSITRPLDRIEFEFGDQLAQMCDPLDEHAGFVFGRHGGEEYYRGVIPEEKRNFCKKSKLGESPT